MSRAGHQTDRTGAVAMPSPAPPQGGVAVHHSLHFFHGPLAIPTLATYPLRHGCTGCLARWDAWDDESLWWPVVP